MNLPPEQLSYDVRFWNIRPNKGRRRTTYTVRWLVAAREFNETFQNAALADARRSELLGFARKGIAFDRATGLPLPVLRKINESRTWYDLACEYVDHKWADSSAKHRASIADAMTTVTLALLRTDRGRPDLGTLRKALRGWVFNTKRRQGGDPPPKWADAVAWVQGNTVPLVGLTDPVVVRSALDSLRRLVDGSPAAPNTVRRKYPIFHEALKLAVERRYLDADPIRLVEWKQPRNYAVVDRRRVVNPQQARALLEAVRAQEPAGPALVAFFGCLYYAAMRPSEAAGLRREHLALPEDARKTGTAFLSKASPSVSSHWTDSGNTYDDRGLKHRPVDEVRPVPLSPPLVRLLREHLDQHGTTTDGLLFRGIRGGELNESLYLGIWKKARAEALTPEQAVSPLARVPYDLRHAGVSTWLKGGISPAQVAEWAGHSLVVLLRTYAKCLDGEERTARNLLEDLSTEDEE
jgi:integrase